MNNQSTTITIPGAMITAPTEVAKKVAAFCVTRGITTDAGLKLALVDSLRSAATAATTVPQLSAVVIDLINMYGAVVSSIVTIEPKT